jgi:hypothetical protein
MPEYCVTWTINLEAESALEAAQEALLTHRDPDSTALCFTVQDLEDGLFQEVDLWLVPPSVSEKVEGPL